MGKLEYLLSLQRLFGQYYPHHQRQRLGGAGIELRCPGSVAESDEPDGIHAGDRGGFQNVNPIDVTGLGSGIVGVASNFMSWLGLGGRVSPLEVQPDMLVRLFILLNHGG